MVSPPKQKKIDRKERDNTELAVAASSQPKVVRKVLTNKRFYLDLKNHLVFKKVEKQLKDLGATVEPFLVKEITGLITDRVDSNSAPARSSLQSPTASASPSVVASVSPTLIVSPTPSPVNTNSPSDGIAGRRSRTRAEAMIESIRQQPNRVLYVADPLENARAWKIPIFPLNKFLRWLESRTEQAPKSRSSGVTCVKQLKGHYIKLEQPGLRPEFREFDALPKLNYKTAGSPFDTVVVPPKRKSIAATAAANTSSKRIPEEQPCGGNDVKKPARGERMTRKKPPATDSDKNGGYCELCHSNYASLSEHLKSVTHMKYAGDSSRFAILDNLLMQSFRSNLNGDMCPTLLTSPNKRVLRSSNKSPITAHFDGHDIMGNKQANSDKNTNPDNTNSDKQNQDKPTPEKQLNQSCAAPLALTNVCATTAMTNGHATRSTTAVQRQQTTVNSNHCLSVEQNSAVVDTDVNKKSPAQPPPLQEVQYNGVVVNHCHLTRLSVKTESQLVQQQVQLAQQQNLSPSGSESNSSSSHHLRSKKQLYLPLNLMGTTAEDEGNPIRLPSSKSVSPKAKRKKLRRKRLSVEEKLIEDNKSYYKVEVLNSKLRSTGYYMTQRELELNRCKPNDDTDDQTKVNEKEPVVVRFKKVRKSELSLLSDEAESFMFGEPARKESDNEGDSSDNETEDKSSSGTNDLKPPQEIKREEHDESSMGSCSSAGHSVKRKRRTHAEVFIHDNLDYYKFDIQGSRLRMHNGMIPPSEMKCKIEEEEKVDVTKIKQESELESNRYDNMKAENLTFSFEMIPESEPWYQTFKRQDKLNEIYYPITSDYPKMKLPYEYNNIQKQKLVIDANRLCPFRRKRHRRFLKNLDDKPRKSPRCHASTLAILSSLKYRRKRDSPKKSESSPIKMPPPVTQIIVPDEESRSSLIDVQTNPVLKVPEIKIVPDIPEVKEVKMKEVSAKVDSFFCKLYEEDLVNDKYVRVMKQLKQLLVNEHRDDITSSSSLGTPKNKTKTSKSSPKYNNSVNIDENLEVLETDDWSPCMDVDPEMIKKMDLPKISLKPGPQMDVITMLDSLSTCNSMLRINYEHLHPRAIDALRCGGIEGSCNSSDYGGSSTGEVLGFTEDGKIMTKRRKRKKRNMTGWPKDKPRRLIKNGNGSTRNDESKCDESKCDLPVAVPEEDFVRDSGERLPQVDDSLSKDLPKVVNEPSGETFIMNLPDSIKLNKRIPIIKVKRTHSCDEKNCKKCLSQFSARPLLAVNKDKTFNTTVSIGCDAKTSMVKRPASSPEKKSPGREKRRRTCVSKWSPWSPKRGR